MSRTGPLCSLSPPLTARTLASLASRAIEAVLYGYYVDEERFLLEGGELKKQRLSAVRKDNMSEVPLSRVCAGRVRLAKWGSFQLMCIGGQGEGAVLRSESEHILRGRKAECQRRHPPRRSCEKIGIF